MDIVILVFPRVVVTDNHFREKQVNNKKAQLSFVQNGDKGFAQELANHVDKNDSDIDGVFVETRVISVEKTLSADNVPVVIFIAEERARNNFPVLICQHYGVQK